MKKYDKDYVTYLENFVTDKRRETFRNILEMRTRFLTVVLEDLYQMHNISAVVRSCDIFGIQDVHIIQEKYQTKLSHGIAKGAEKWLSIHNYKNTREAIQKLKSKGYQIVATTPHTDALYLPDFMPDRKSAFFFGVEKDGLSEEVLSQADIHLKIPMYGFTESFNISVAAALILYDSTQKLRHSGLDWKLTADEKMELYQEWLEKTIKSIDSIKKKYFSQIRKND